MNHTIYKWIKRSTLSLGALLLLAACSDDHFDVVAGNGEKTIWENIEANSELSDFATLLKRIKVMKNENDRSSTLRASELVNQNQSFTLWAPKNGTFNAKAWNDSLDVVEQLLKEGTPASQARAYALDYKIWNQFAANHIARFNHEGQGRDYYVRLLNYKRTNYTGSTFNGVKLEGDAVVASNGALHTLAGQSPFAYNIYDYMSSHPDFSRLNGFIKDPSIDKNTFVPNISVPGAMNEEGKMVYIDSVYIRQNELLTSFNAQIANEDSTYIALIPNNTAWDEAVEKVGKLFNYGRAYAYDWQGSDFTKNKPATMYRLDGKLLDGQGTHADSLRAKNVRRSIVSSLFFNPRLMNNIDRKDSAQLINYVQHADSLVTTTKVVFYNPAAVKGVINGALNPALAGLKPYHASNGYVFPLNHYDFNPAYSFVRRQEYDSYSGAVVKTGNAVAPRGKVLRLTDINYNKWQEQKDDEGNPILVDGQPVFDGIKGEVPGQVYTRFEQSSETANMTIDFALRNMYSTDYTIKLVLLPSKINFDHYKADDEPEVVKFTAAIVDDEDNYDRTHEVTIDQEAGQFDPTKVNEVVLWDKYSIQKCYVDLGGGKISFPRLRITLPRKAAGKKWRCKALNIAKVIVEPYRGETVAP